MNFILRRLAFYLVALWGALTINFVLPRVMPGSPLDALRVRFQDEIRHNPKILDNLKAQLGHDNELVWAEYPRYLKQMLTGDLGISTSHYPSPVTDVLAAALPWTLVLAGAATVLSFVIGTILGILVAWRRGGLLDSVLPPITMFLSAFPAFFAALLAVYFLGLQQGWFPLQHAWSGDTTPGLNGAYLWDVARHAALPVIVLVATSLGGWLIGMRNVMINTLAEEFITMANAKGLSDRRVMFAYAARNAILPNLTGFALALGFAIGGVILIENVFSYPGVGRELVLAATGSDYPLAQALFLLISVCVIAANFTIDLLYARLDPRTRTQ